MVYLGVFKLDEMKMYIVGSEVLSSLGCSIGDDVGEYVENMLHDIQAETRVTREINNEE